MSAAASRATCMMTWRALTEIVLLGELAKRGEQTPAALQDQFSGI